MRKLITGLAVTMALISCGSGLDPEPQPKPQPGPEPEPEKIPVQIATSITKVTDNSFDAGDAVGIYVVNRENGAAAQLTGETDHIVNARFTYSSGEWSPEHDYYWKDERTHADFYCYYPYVETVSDVSALPIGVNSDQSALSAYKSSDYLWGKTSDAAPDGNPVSIQVKHRMSKLIIKIAPGTGYSAETLGQDIKSVRILNLVCGATMDLSTGTVTPSGAACDMIPYAEDESLCAFVVPQKVEDAALIRVELSDRSCTLTQSIEFLSGTQHTCTLKINKLSEGVNITIGGWEKDDIDYGGVLD